MGNREKRLLEMNRAELIAEIMHLQDDAELLEKNNTAMSWRLNPDRMGGQFTEEELNRHSGL
jgi:vacuolar-type H+-ATPase subunit D/Vma8